MKKIGIWFLVFSFLCTSSFAAVEDNSILEELTKDNVEELNHDFNLKTFQSCDAMESVMEDYIKSYWKKNKNNYRYPVFYAVDDLAIQESSDISVSAKSSIQADGIGGWWGDFSQTNTQVQGVDESDIIKTDGKYIYYFNQTNHAVYIVKSAQESLFWSSEMEVIKKINLPKNFWSPVLYLDNNRLIITASWYSNTDYSKRGYYINRNSKTYTIVFDTSNIKSPKLIKLYASDGNLRDSRKIGEYLYVISNNYFNIPYYNFKDEEDIDIDFGSIMPKKLDISKTSDSSKQNLKLKGKSFPYNIKAWNIADCNSIEYSFPDEETLKKNNFNPWYNIISIINIQDSEQEVKTKVIAGSNSNLYMSLNNLYLTESIYQPNNFSCPPNARCVMPFFWGGTQNTLVHKLGVEGMNIGYKTTGLVPWAPLNQYSMDEKDTNFRIITSEWQPERSTGLYILDEDLELVSSLTGLAPGESFQSSRFIGDKLFLVTFEQIDPLFAIDLSNQEKPEILGELKIPGFSTYLHPYDDTHIIGLGNDTQENQWGWTTTAGLKVDLYKINYDKKCWDSWLTAVQEEKCESGDYKWIIVEQLYTETFGWQGSYSEALHNPRMFVWNSQKNTLLLPATLYERDENYRNTDFYNGIFSIKVDKDSGIEVESQATHIDTSGLEQDREEECSKYSVQEEEPECKELLDGSLYCGGQTQQKYIPNYCFADSPIWEYLANRSWQFNKSFIKRTLYIGEEVYAISDDKISTHEFSTLEDIDEVEMK